jgi:hypothetical protein
MQGRVKMTSPPRGLQATLRGLRLPNGTFADICSTAGGVAFC